MTTRKEIIAACELYLGDCREILPTLGKVDAVCTDPPYGVAFDGKNTKHTARIGEGYEREDDPTVGPMVVRMALSVATRGLVFPGNRRMWLYPEPYEIGAVSCPSGAGNGRWGWVCSHPILYYGKPAEGHSTPNGFTSFDVAEQNGHPCPKPLRWMLWAVRKVANEGETILDPFMGSGTTGVACVKLGRRFIGIEIEERYFSIACRRIEEATKQGDLFISQPKRDAVAETPLLPGM